MEFKLALGVLVLAHVVACSSHAVAPRTYPTSAQMIAAGSPELRVVDNAGYVSPAGHTREVRAGISGSTFGRGNGVAPPRREEPNSSGAYEAERSSGPAPIIAAPVDAAELSERMANAACDRERYCGRAGEGRKPFASVEDCRAVAQERVRRALDAASCNEIRGDRMDTCLAALRLDGSCGAPLSGTLVPACTPRSLCDPGPASTR